jgi:hypothetical protein
VLFGQIALLLRRQVDALLDRELELLLRPLEHSDRLAVIHTHEFRADDRREFHDQPLLDPLVEEGEVFPSLSFSNAAKVYFSSASANAALSERSANAISGSIIQNSARWRLVFEFSARKVSPKV